MKKTIGLAVLMCTTITCFANRSWIPRFPRIPTNDVPIVVTNTVPTTTTTTTTTTTIPPVSSPWQDDVIIGIENCQACYKGGRAPVPQKMKIVADMKRVWFEGNMFKYEMATKMPWPATRDAKPLLGKICLLWYIGPDLWCFPFEHAAEGGRGGWGRGYALKNNIGTNCTCGNKPIVGSRMFACIMNYAGTERTTIREAPQHWVQSLMFGVESVENPEGFTEHTDWLTVEEIKTLGL